MGPSMGLNGVSVRVHNEYNIVKNEIFSVTITYRVREFEIFFENFVQGTRCPPLKSHIPLKDTVSLPKDLSPKLKRI